MIMSLLFFTAADFPTDYYYMRKWSRNDSDLRRSTPKTDPHFVAAILVNILAIFHQIFKIIKVMTSHFDSFGLESESNYTVNLF